MKLNDVEMKKPLFVFHGREVNSIPPCPCQCTRCFLRDIYQRVNMALGCLLSGNSLLGLNVKTNAARNFVVCSLGFASPLFSVASTPPSSTAPIQLISVHM